MAKTGRPTESGTPKLAPLNMRTSPQLREQIEKAAEMNGRSLTQEVERRLMTSFIFDEVRGGPHIGALANMVCASIQMIEQETGHRWMDDFNTFAMVRAAMDRLLAWKNPGADLRDEVRLLAEQEQASEAETKARVALATFHSAKGLKPLLGGALSMAGTTSLPSDYKTRRDWSEADFEEEERLEALVEAARIKAATARRAHDDWMSAAFARLAKVEERGANIANAIFHDQGPRG